eukprot:3876794-Rhodomonas_salina.6
MGPAARNACPDRAGRESPSIMPDRSFHSRIGASKSSACRSLKNPERTPRRASQLTLNLSSLGGAKRVLWMRVQSRLASEHPKAEHN